MSDGESQQATDSAPIDSSQHDLESNSDDSQLQEVKGWLNKRTKISHKWKRLWCTLRKTDLFYGQTEVNAEDVTSQSSQLKRICLDGAEICESDIDKKQFAFRLRPASSKRYYYFHCDDEETQQQWMQAICFAKAASKSDASATCVVQ